MNPFRYFSLQKLNHLLDAIYTMRFLRSFVFYLALVIWGVTMYLLFSPNPFFWIEKAMDFPSRGAHFVLFSTLAFITYVAQKRPQVFRTILLVCLFGFLSEVIQYFEPVRSFEWMDFFEDVLGAVAGTFSGFVAWNLARKLLTLYRSHRNRIKPPVVTTTAKYPKIG